MRSGKWWEGQTYFQFCQSNLIGFLLVTLAHFTRSFSFRHFLEDFFLPCELVMKDIFCHKLGTTSQMVKKPWSPRGQFVFKVCNIKEPYSVDHAPI